MKNIRQNPLSIQKSRSLFVLSRSIAEIQGNAKVVNGSSKLYFFLEMRTSSRNRVCHLSRVWDRSVRRGTSESSNKDGDSKD